MKKLASMVVAVGLLAACERKTPQQAAVADNAAALEASLERAADNLEAQADAAANVDAAAALQEAATNLSQASDNVADAADARIDNLR